MNLVPDFKLEQIYNFFKFQQTSLTYEKFKEALNAVGICLSKKEEKEYGAKNNFSLDDFKETYKNKSKEYTKEEFINCFKIFAPEGNGLINEEQFKKVMTSYGLDKFSKDEYNKFMEQYDKEKDGNFHYEYLIEEFSKN